MIKKASVFILFAFVLCTVNAQPAAGLRHSDTFSGKESIVRQWHNGIAIAYSQESSTQGNFIYDAGDSALVYADMYPNCRVYDFEIREDTVYFCGKFENGSNIFGFFGFFDINDLFFNGGSMYGTYLNMSQNQIFYDLNLKPTAPSRMDVFVHQDQTHIAAIGDCLLQGNSTDIDGSSVYDVYYDGTDWHCKAYYHKPGMEYYTDIVATGNYIVAVAKGEVQNKCYIRLFEKGSDFLSSASAQYMTDVADDTPVGRVIVDALEGDNFAVANFYTNSSEAGVTLKKLHVTTTLPYTALTSSIHVPLNISSTINTNWKLRDIRYNDGLAKLALLLDMDYPVHTTVKSTILETDIPYLTTSNIAASWLDNIVFYGIDQWNNGYYAIGEQHSSPPFSLNKLTLFKKHFGIGHPCSDYSEPVPFYENTQAVGLNSVIVNPYNVEPIPYPIQHTPTIVKIKIDIDCEVRK